MPTLKLYLDTRTTRKDGTCHLKTAVNHCGKTAFIPLYIYLRPDQWDAARSRVVNCPQKAVLNLAVQNHLNQITNALVNLPFTAKGRNRTALEIRDTLVAVLNPEEETAPKDTLKDAFTRFAEAHGNPRTRQIYFIAWRKIEKYCPDKASRLTYEDITRDWLLAFSLWLEKDTPKVNARNVYLRCLRAVFNDAIDNERTTLYPFRKFRIRTERTAKRSLPIEDIRTLFNIEVDEDKRKYIDAFRLIFLLIGINIGDLCDLTTDNIRNGRIEFHRKKTHRFYSIKIEPEAQAILDKYSGGKYLFSPRDRYKTYEKFTAVLNPALGKLRPGLTTYWARHSWATIAASLDIPKETIAAALGHGAYSVTDIYIDFDQRKVDAANRRVIDWVLRGKK